MAFVKRLNEARRLGVDPRFCRAYEVDAWDHPILSPPNSPFPVGGLWHCFKHITQFVRQKFIRVFEWFGMYVFFFWCEQLQGLQIVSRSLCGGHFLQRDSRPDDARSELPDHSDGWLLQMKPDGSEAWAVDEAFKTGRLNAITEVKMPEKEREREREREFLRYTLCVFPVRTWLKTGFIFTPMRFSTVFIVSVPAPKPGRWEWPPVCFLRGDGNGGAVGCVFCRRTKAFKRMNVYIPW